MGGTEVNIIGPSTKPEDRELVYIDKKGKENEYGTLKINVPCYGYFIPTEGYLDDKDVYDDVTVTVEIEKGVSSFKLVKQDELYKLTYTKSNGSVFEIKGNELIDMLKDKIEMPIYSTYKRYAK